MDVFCCPSQSEAFGLVVLEAMAAGVPVVASDIDGLREIITDKKDGLLVDPLASERFADAILLLLREEGLRGRITDEAHAMLKRRFAISRMADEVIAVYKEVVR
jgi:glycosyltransferase involved in cell wall biosynthesis